MATSDTEIRKAFKRNNLRISDAAVLSRIAAIAEEHGYSATELSDKYDFYTTNRCAAVSEPTEHCCRSPHATRSPSVWIWFRNRPS